MSHLLISAARKSSGKTTVSTGIIRALALRGHVVQPFKKGPDYIDPMWLSAATSPHGRPCRNLDYNTMAEEEIVATFSHHSDGADFCLIEGNKGLYDGLDLGGGDSSAALASLLGAPVVLVVDAGGITRGVAPLILGYQAFKPKVKIAGVIFNKVGGGRHEAKLRAAIEHYTDVPVLGAIHRQPQLEIPERHLGLIPSNEAADAEAKIAAIAQVISGQVDLDCLLEIAAPSPAAAPQPRPAGLAPDVRIGIARDSAFGFYYPDDLEALAAARVELVPINLLSARRLAEIDGLIIGGGFPETHMAALEANAVLRRQIHDAIEAGLPTYAECGGLMYLARSLSWRGEVCEMAGVIAGDAVMHEKPQGRGYVRLRETGRSPWSPLGPPLDNNELPAHEFHYSSLENLGFEPVYAYEVLRGAGIDGRHDGLVINNLLASFAHLRNVGGNLWARRFVDFVRACKDKNSNIPAERPGQQHINLTHVRGQKGGA